MVDYSTHFGAYMSVGVAMNGASDLRRLWFSLLLFTCAAGYHAHMNVAVADKMYFFTAFCLSDVTFWPQCLSVAKGIQVILICVCDMFMGMVDFCDGVVSGTWAWQFH